MARRRLAPALRPLAAALLLLAWPGPAAADLPAALGGGEVRAGIAMHGQPLYADDFDHLSYANPDAPVGGELRQAVVGSFDSINPFLIQGRTVRGAREYLFPQLMARVWDEPFSLYGYVAEAIEVPADRRWAIFHLNPTARWDDGSPITVADVIFSMETLRDEGLPSFRRNYERIAAATPVGEHAIRFDFTAEADRETVMLIGIMPLISQAFYADRDFGQPGLEPPVSGGPYRVASIDPGRSIVYERVEDWWGHDLPVMRGHNNFARLRFDYFRDDGVALEAFRAGAYNLRREFSAETWASGYGGLPASVTLATLDNDRPSGLRGFAYNTRRPLFADIRVRQALGLLFDFEWVNANLLFGQYVRISSLFDGSPLEPVGEPAGAELALLEAHRAAVDPAVFGPPFAPSMTDGSGNIRPQLREALALFAEAGWEVADGALTHTGTGQRFAFEILLRSAGDERIALAWADNLRRAGIAVEVRTVDSAQYVARTEVYDFDVILNQWGVTLSPGAEQYLYWGSGNRDTPGSRNYAGVTDPVVDDLIGTLEDAADYEALVAAARALDRVLMAGHYALPLYYLDRDFWAWHGNFHHVDAAPLYGLVIEAFWLEP